MDVPPYPKNPPLPPSPPPASPSPPLPPFNPLDLKCNEDCNHSQDNECDDGGPGAEYSICPNGSDCADCGDRGTDLPPPSPTLPIIEEDEEEKLSLLARFGYYIGLLVRLVLDNIIMFFYNIGNAIGQLFGDKDVEELDPIAQQEEKDRLTAEQNAGTS